MKEHNGPGGEIVQRLDNPPEVYEPAVIGALTRAELDSQIATARTFPRSLDKFLREARTYIHLDPEIAAQCTYRLPVRKGSTEPISGPSVRLAEIAAACYGNLRITGRIVADDGRFVTAQGVAVDLEKNLGYSMEVKRPVTDRNGRRYSDDMIRTTCNAAIAIATRNVTFKVLPRALVTVLQDEAAAVARGDHQSLPQRLGRALKWFANRGVSEARVFQALGVAGPADCTLDHLETLNGYRTSIQDGQASLEEIFPSPAAPAPPSRVQALEQALATKAAEASGATDYELNPPLAATTQKAAPLSDAQARAKFGPGAEG